MEVVSTVGGAVLGGIAGSEKDVSKQYYDNFSRTSVDVGAQSELEKTGEQASLSALQSLQQQLDALQKSPIQAQFSSLLKELGTAPSQERINQANQYTEQVFAPRQTALQQSLEDQQRQFAARAAQLGRSTADPILAAKLAQEQVRQQNALAAEKGSFAAQEAINAPLRQFQNLGAGISGLSQQAIQNQSAIFNLGSSLAEQLRNFRIQTATRTTQGNGSQTNESGGGFKGAVTGLFGGASAGIKTAQAFGGFNQAGAPNK